MSKAKITLVGLSNYMESVGNDLFLNLSTPSGIDKSLLINNILLKGAEFEVLYPEPYFMQNMIGIWSDKWQHTMQRWINALSIDYNPLENYDRMEDWIDKSSRLSNSNTGEKANNNSSIYGSNNSIKNENNLKNETAFGNDHSISSGDGETTNERSAYDASNYSPHDKSTSETSGDNVAGSMTSAQGLTNTKDVESNVSQNISASDDTKQTINNSFDNSIGNHEGRTHGNIGVTTSQQMLQAELDIAKWNLYDEIADLFLSEFCIYIY